MAALPVRRALLDHPQRLGFLPTLWFWNDRERQHLMMPLIVTMAVPMTALFLVLMAWLELPVWLLLVFGTAWPQLLLGLVERRVRRGLGQRALDGGPAGGPPLQAGDRVTLSLACLGACGASIAVAASWGLWPAMLTGLVLASFAGVTWTRLAQRERAAFEPPGSNKPQQLAPPETQR
ncbi:MAG TPA: hypothetical protein VIK91_13640 [Nannocystis sp.]